ncbi:MAG TPA: sialidase family protein [Bryobacteraceae bacterium]|nr:sialidase family protein [Bryobacteraceae bacterium]
MIRTIALCCFLLPLAPAADFETGAVRRSDAQYYRNAIPQIARLGDGRLFAVWQVAGKTDNRSRVVGATSSDGARTWANPRILIQDAEKADGDPNILVDGNKVWVYSTRVTVPNRIAKAWTMVTRSEDNGETWSAPVEVFIPRQYTPGKQHNAIRLDDGTYAMGISWDLWAEKGLAARTEGEMELASGLLRSTDGMRWTLNGDIHAWTRKVTPGSTNGLCEPSIVQLRDGEILMILRSGSSRHYEARSRDGGITWSRPQPSALVGHNTPTALWRLEQHPQEIVAVWNHSPSNRYPLSAALSADGGKTWSRPRILANPIGYQVSYPGLTQTADGTLVTVWQQQLPDGGRDVRWARFTRDWLLGEH